MDISRGLFFARKELWRKLWVMVIMGNVFCLNLTCTYQISSGQIVLYEIGNRGWPRSRLAKEEFVIS